MESETIELKNAFGICQISLVGAQITSWVPAEGTEVLFMPADTPWGAEVHGGIPLCWPWYGKSAIPGFAAHGVARYVAWIVEEQTDECVRLALMSSDETRHIWPHDFRLSYEVSMARNSLVCRLSAMNVGEAPFEASDAFHPYFFVRDIEKCHVDDDPDFVTRPAHLSRYLPDAVESRVLSGAGIARTVRISGKGHSGWWYWNSGEDQTPAITSLAPDDWRRFVCIEPVTRDCYCLEPGETRTIEMQLAII